MPRLPPFLRSLKSRIVATVVATALLAALGTGGLMLSATQKELRGLLERNERADRERTSTLMSSKVQTVVDALKTIAQRAATIHWDDHEALERLALGPALNSLYDGVFAVRADGQVIVSVDRGAPVRSALPSIGDRDYFRQALQGDQPVISRALRHKITEAPIVVVAVPVLAPDGHAVGMIGGVLALQSNGLFSALRYKDVQDGVIDLVVDRDGIILSHPNVERVLGRAADEPGLRDVIERWRADGSPIEFDGRAELAGEHLVSSAGIPLTDWLHLRVTPAAQAMEPVAEARSTAFASAGLMALLAAVVASAVAWRLVSPLGVLRARAEQLRSGEVSGTWPSGDDEIGAVSRSFQALLGQREHQESALRGLLDQLEAVLDNAEVGIALSRGDDFVMASRRFCRMLRCERSQIIGQSARRVHPDDAAYEAFSERVRSAFEAHGVFEGEVPLVRCDGESFWARVRGRAVVPDDCSQGTIWVIDDVTESRRQRERLSWAASHDALTDLANRAAFEVLLEDANARAAEQPFCALFIDLDRFKLVNDTGGHAAGDALLRGVARALQAALRSTDTVARLGGDEFAVLLPGCPVGRARELAEALRSAVENYRLVWSGQTFGVGASVGLVLANGGHASAAELLCQADAACYEAKRTGRNRVAIHT